ncbi:MAG: TniQ family protein [Pseudoruegeria sp.]
MIYGRLGLTLLIGEHEPAVTYASRIAALNGCTSLWSFCGLTGLSALKLVQGDQDTLSRLSDLTGTDRSELERFTPITMTRATRSLGGQVFPNKVIKIQTQHICPRCISDSPADRDWYFTAPDVFWYLDFVRTCPKHGLLLVPLPENQSGWFPYDFAARLTRAQISRDALEGMMVSAPTAVDAYSISSFSGTAALSWLNDCDAYAVSRTSERLGCTVEGVTSAKYLARSELARLADIGFAVLSEGPDALRATLLDLINKRGRSGIRRVFGVFFNLMDGKMGDEISSVRKVLREVILENFIIQPGDILLGEPCLKRRFHSLQSAADQTGVHPTKVASVLTAAGLMPRHEDTKLIQIEAEPAEEMLRRLSNAVLTRDALKFLGLPWRHMMSLQDAGLISPINPACGGHYMYCRHELIKLRDAMCQNGRDVGQEGIGLVPIYKAANQSVCGIAEVAKLLVSGCLEKVGLVNGVRTFDSIRVDPTEVFEALPAYEAVAAAMTREDLLQHFGVCGATVAFLLREGHFDEFRARCRTSRKVRSYVTKASVDQFSGKYISLKNLAKEQKVSGRVLSHHLKGEGLYELPVPSRCRGRFFRLTDVSALFGTSGPIRTVSAA